MARLLRTCVQAAGRSRQVCHDPTEYLATYLHSMYPDGMCMSAIGDGPCRGRRSGSQADGSGSQALSDIAARKAIRVRGGSWRQASVKLPHVSTPCLMRMQFPAGADNKHSSGGWSESPVAVQVRARQRGREIRDYLSEAPQPIRESLTPVSMKGLRLAQGGRAAGTCIGVQGHVVVVCRVRKASLRLRHHRRDGPLLDVSCRLYATCAGQSDGTISKRAAQTREASRLPRHRRYRTWLSAYSAQETCSQSRSRIRRHCDDLQPRHR